MWQGAQGARRSRARRCERWFRIVLRTTYATRQSAARTFVLCADQIPGCVQPCASDSLSRSLSDRHYTVRGRVLRLAFPIVRPALVA